MSQSKQFIPKTTHYSPPSRSNVKVWGQQSKSLGLDSDRKNTVLSNRGFKSFTADKDKISKIFAPKLTVIDNNISIGNNVTNTKVKQNNESENNKSKIIEEEIFIQNIRHNQELQDNNLTDKTKTFISALFPKISFGKYTFGGFRSKVKTDSKDLNNSNQKDEILRSYDPEIIFRKLNDNSKVEPKANFFKHIKKTSSKAAGNWWDSIKFDYYEKKWFRKLNYQFVAFDIAKNINRLIIVICSLSIIGFFVYLAFFDQYFTIKKYTVQYSNGSYLNNQQTFELISHFQNNKLYKIFPNNQYWFANNLSLTASAKEIFPEISSINIKNRDWPNQVSLQIETNKPILTLWVTENNEQKYWRINDNGKILSQDKAAIWFNLVKVEKPYSLQGDNTMQLSLFNHSFENEPTQRQRFKVTKLLLDYFKAIDIQIITTSYPSISDTDIVMEAANGTKFIFDSLVFEPEAQVARLDYFLKAKSNKSDFYELQNKGQFSYFDFRISQKIYICKTSEKCNTNNKPQEIDKKK